MTRLHLETAKITKEAAQLRSDNLKLEAQIQPRRLKQDEENAIIGALKGFEFKAKVAIVSYAFDVESSALVAQIIDIAYHSRMDIENALSD